MTQGYAAELGGSEEDAEDAEDATKTKGGVTLKSDGAYVLKPDRLSEKVAENLNGLRHPPHPPNLSDQPPTLPLIFSEHTQESLEAWYIDANGKKKIESFPDFMTRFLTSLCADNVKPLDIKPSKAKQHSPKNDGTDNGSDAESSSEDNAASSSPLPSIDEETAESIVTATMSMALWHSPDATTAVSKMLRKSFTQLFTQALFVFHSFPDKESVRIKFYCGWYLIVLLFNRPPSILFSYEDLDKDGKLSAEKLVKLFPHEVILDGVRAAAGFQPTFIVPLVNMFTFNAQGKITGFEEAYLDTFREIIVEVAPNRAPTEYY
ncbi:hypothetical protein D9758_004935 [Tetrapyrgos nigripes]|uniref:Uncharacterized protein n=1 Tax=Tetrapyrgos nigripes TaxID=182062 RepID=A0A8H5GVW8_9AGAR|nr:hypothetical protein D9758_004935 [Tetrapyrgos nigripes]